MFLCLQHILCSYLLQLILLTLLCFQIGLWGYVEHPTINSLALKPTANITSLSRNVFSWDAQTQCAGQEAAFDISACFFPSSFFCVLLSHFTLKHCSIFSDATFSYKLLLMYFFNSVVWMIRQHPLKFTFPCLTRQWALYLIMDQGPDMETLCLKPYVFICGQFVRLNYIQIFAYSAT